MDTDQHVLWEFHENRIISRVNVTVSGSSRMKITKGCKSSLSREETNLQIIC